MVRRGARRRAVRSAPPSPPRRVEARVPGAVALAVAAWASGCSDCGRAPRLEPYEDDAASPAASASPEASAGTAADAPAAAVVARGLGKPRSLVVDATHVYFADALTGTIGRVPREGGAPEDLATGRETPGRLAFSGEELVWLDGGGSFPSAAPEGGVVARGVFACSPAKVPCSVRAVRAGTFVTLVAAGGQLLVAENLDSTRFVVSRVTDEGLTRVGEHEGRATAMTADRANAYVATFSPLDRATIVTLPLAKGAPSAVTLRGPGFNNVDADGEQLFGTGILDRRFGLFRVTTSGSDAKRGGDAASGGAVTFLAPDVAPGLYARRGDDVYFVGGADRSLRKVSIGGGSSTVVGRLTGIDEPGALAIADGWAYVGGKAAGDAGGAGAIVRLSLGESSP